MATNQYEKQRREHERILRGLERRYDKEGQHLRQYTEDCINISKLVNDKVIDAAHGELLQERAKVKYLAIEEKKSYDKWLVKRDKQTDSWARRITFIIGLIAVLFFLFLTKACGSN